MALSSVKILRIPCCFPIHLGFSFAHWRREGTNHGPQSFPRFIALSWVKLDVTSPCSGHRLWVYLRGGYAFFVEVLIDRRGDVF